MEHSIMEPSRKLDVLAKSVIGAAIEVHKHLGPGYLESVYEEALSIELQSIGVQHQRQSEVFVKYKDCNVGKSRLDIMVENQLVVELKTVENLLPVHKAQVISYLKATGNTLGLLINFNVPVLKQGIQRVIYSK
ncbi:MAG: GxxExxY protein [Gammaproteobacteria bacterium]|nr:MAG: GxxExxY protein [Gammaproteobacteria bacterium]